MQAPLRTQQRVRSAHDLPGGAAGSSFCCDAADGAGVVLVCEHPRGPPGFFSALAIKHGC